MLFFVVVFFLSIEFCISILACPSPPTISNGNVQGNPPYVSGESVTYTCLVNYVLQGSATNTCNGPPNYDWSLTNSNLPTCVRPVPTQGKTDDNGS